jgi:hypothetical protein
MNIPVSFVALFVLTFVTNTAHAKVNPLLQCLAKEEERLHKKAPDALFRLNQEFINELASANDITLKKEFVDEICTSKKHSPSVALLKLLLIKESEIYDLSLSEVDQSMRPFKMGYINEFQKQVPRMFFSYLSGLQSEMATPHCLEKNIPELVGFAEKIKYLEEEISMDRIINDKQITTIFKKLEGISEIKARCLAQSKVVKKKKNASL